MPIEVWEIDRSIEMGRSMSDYLHYAVMILELSAISSRVLLENYIHMCTVQTNGPKI